MAGATERLERGERLEGQGSQVVDQAAALIGGAGEESRQGPVRDDRGAEEGRQEGEEQPPHPRLPCRRIAVAACRFERREYQAGGQRCDGEASAVARPEKKEV